MLINAIAIVAMLISVPLLAFHCADPFLSRPLEYFLLLIALGSVTAQLVVGN